MPKYLVTQRRDAIKCYLALITAQTPQEAQALALDDQCHWIPDCTHDLDDREIRLDEIERVAHDHAITRARVNTTVWILHIDNGNDSPSAELYADKITALIAFEAALAPYMTTQERTRFAGNPQSACRAILDHNDGDFPYGHVCRLDEQTLRITPNP